MYLAKWTLEKIISLIIIPFYRCNFNCSYCIQDHSKNSKNELNLKEISFFLHKKFFPIFENTNSSLNISLMGGELTIKPISWNKKLLELIKPKKQLNYKYVFFTNFSQSINYYLDLINFSQQIDLNLELNITYHSEYFSFKKFVNKLINLKNHINNFNVSFFYTKDELKKLFEQNFSIELFELFKPNISFLDLNYQKYDKFFEKNKKYLRPVFCDGHVYILDSTKKLKLICRNKEIDYLRFFKKMIEKPILCNKKCSCDSFEYEIFKKLKN